MSAPPAELVLLLHGQPGGARDWAAVRAAVDGRVPLLAVDRPGWRAGTAAVDLAGNAADALRALDAAGVSRAVVAGHSLGAAVAAWLAAAWPERVAALVLVAPAANTASLVPVDHWMARGRNGELVGAPVMAGAGLALALAPVRRRIARWLGVADSYLADTARGLLTPREWRAFAADQRALVRDLPALERRLPSIAAPTTVVAGSADRVVPLSAARALAATIPGASLSVVPGAGHLLLQQHAGRVAEVLVSAAG